MSGSPPPRGALHRAEASFARSTDSQSTHAHSNFNYTSNSDAQSNSASSGSANPLLPRSPSRRSSISGRNYTATDDPFTDSHPFSGPRYKRSSYGKDGKPLSVSSKDSADKLDVPAKAVLPPERAQALIFGDRADFRENVNKMLSRAEIKAKWLSFPRWLRWPLQAIGYLLIACVIYFVVVGRPLWKGALYEFWFSYKDHLNLSGGVAIFIGVSLIFALLPLTGHFEKEPVPTEKDVAENAARAARTALVIPCHKSAELLPATLAAALKTFPPQNIFVIDNSRDETPPDRTGEVCKEYGVRYIYVPIASKIAAQFIGVQSAYSLDYVLMIDDDVALPDYFPVVTDRIQTGPQHGLVKCIGYTIRSVGAGGAPGTLCQQAQCIEYLRSGLMRCWLGSWASVTFPHGAINLWDRPFLEECFRRHPGYTISEDWFLGHVCRSMGGRIKMCSQVIVSTETPANAIFSGKGLRAGYGEMTVTRQRVFRWNFFFPLRIWLNSWYILARWRLGRFELGTKLYVFQEIYDSLLLLGAPWIVPIAIGVNPKFTIPIIVAVVLMYYVITIIINEVHLRRRGVRVGTKAVYLYTPFYLTYLRLCGIASVYMALFNYVRYFTKRHPKVTEDQEILRLMLNLANKPYSYDNEGQATFDAQRDMQGVRVENV